MVLFISRIELVEKFWLLMLLFNCFVIVDTVKIRDISIDKMIRQLRIVIVLRFCIVSNISYFQLDNNTSHFSMCFQKIQFFNFLAQLMKIKFVPGTKLSSCSYARHALFCVVQRFVKIELRIVVWSSVMCSCRAQTFYSISSAQHVEIL